MRRLFEAGRRLFGSGVYSSKYVKWNVRDFTCWSIWMCREICHFVGKKAQKGQQVHFKAVKKLRKRSGFVIYSWYVKDNAFTVVERDAKFYTWCVKGVSFINRRYTKGGTFLSKMVYKRVFKGSNLGVEPSPYTIFLAPPETLWTRDEAQRTSVCLGGLTYFRSSPCFTIWSLACVAGVRNGMGRESRARDHARGRSARPNSPFPFQRRPRRLSDHRKVTRDDRKYVCVQSLLQMKPLSLWPSFFGEFSPLKTLPKEIFVFLNF